jgi:hypothetical protein
MPDRTGRAAVMATSSRPKPIVVGATARASLATSSASGPASHATGWIDDVAPAPA